MCSTKETSPFIDSQITDLGWSTAIPLCARIESETKTKFRVNDKQSICVVTEHIRELATDVGGLIDVGRFKLIGRLDPKGATLPPVNLFEMSINQEDEGIPF